MNKPKINFIVLVGTSGAGKGTIIKKLLAKDSRLAQIKGYTTRQPRAHSDKEKYNFVTKKQFQTLIERGEIIEWTKQADVYYGTSAKSLKKILKSGKIGIRDADIRLAERLKAIYPGKVLAIYIKAPEAYLKLRLRNRGGDSEASIAKRLAQAKSVALEIEKSPELIDFKLTNKQGELAQTLQKIQAFLSLWTKNNS